MMMADQRAVANSWLPHSESVLSKRNRAKEKMRARSVRNIFAMQFALFLSFQFSDQTEQGEIFAERR